MLTFSSWLALIVCGAYFLIFTAIVCTGRHLDHRKYFLRDALLSFGLSLLAFVLIATEVLSAPGKLSVTAACWLFLFLGALIWRSTSWQPKWFPAYAGTMTLVPVAAILWVSFHRENEIAAVDLHDPLVEESSERVSDLRNQFPFESLEVRLESLKAPAKARSPLPVETKERLAELEQDISFHARFYPREKTLKDLHEGSVEDFVRREGFGNERIERPSKIWILRGPLQATTVPQPSSFLSASWAEVDLNREPPTVNRKPVGAMHNQTLLDFVDPSRSGYAKSRKQVAGFVPHRINAVHEEEPWKVLRLELVGILKAEQPRVYVTDELPNIKKIDSTATRSLDAFESAGLEKLTAGEHLFIRETSEGIRMLGAVRAVEQCIQCHGGERGDLLGAFSYSLTRTSNP